MGRVIARWLLSRPKRAGRLLLHPPLLRSAAPAAENSVTALPAAGPDAAHSATALPAAAAAAAPADTGGEGTLLMPAPLGTPAAAGADASLPNDGRPCGCLSLCCCCCCCSPSDTEPSLTRCDSRLGPKLRVFRRSLLAVAAAAGAAAAARWLHVSALLLLPFP